MITRENISNTYKDEGDDHRFVAHWSIEAPGVYFWGFMDDQGNLIQEGYYD